MDRRYSLLEDQNFLIKIIPINEDIAVMIKNRTDNVTPIFTSLWIYSKRYKNVNSLAPIPPTVNGKIATIDEIKKMTKRSMISACASKDIIIK